MLWFHFCFCKHIRIKTAFRFTAFTPLKQEQKPKSPISLRANVLTRIEAAWR